MEPVPEAHAVNQSADYHLWSSIFAFDTGHPFASFWFRETVHQFPYIQFTPGPNRRFAALLKSRGFAYEFRTKPGGHDWGEWDSQIPGCFESLFKKVKSVP